MPLVQLSREVCASLLPTQIIMEDPNRTVRLANETFMRYGTVEIHRGTRIDRPIHGQGWVVRVLGHDLIMFPQNTNWNDAAYLIVTPPSEREAHSIFLRRVRELTNADIRGSICTEGGPARQGWRIRYGSGRTPYYMEVSWGAPIWMTADGMYA